MWSWLGSWELRTRKEQGANTCEGNINTLRRNDSHDWIRFREKECFQRKKEYREKGSRYIAQKKDREDIHYTGTEIETETESKTEKERETETERQSKRKKEHYIPKVIYTQYGLQRTNSFDTASSICFGSSRGREEERVKSIASSMYNEVFQLGAHKNEINFPIK